MRNGLGLLLRATGPVPPPVAEAWAGYGWKVSGSGNALPAQLPGVPTTTTGPRRFERADIVFAADDAATLLASDAHVALARWRAHGRGRVGTWTLLDAWKLALGSVALDTVSSRRVEAFYWLTITFSQTLGTALGDWTADDAGFGYLGAGALFAGLLAFVFVLYRFTHVSRAVLFWAAFVLTRPLGAVVGDFLDKPVAAGGLALSRYVATAVLAAAIVLLVALLPQRAAVTKSA